MFDLERKVLKLEVNLWFRGAVAFTLKHQESGMLKMSLSRWLSFLLDCFVARRSRDRIDRDAMSEPLGFVVNWGDTLDERQPS